MGPDGVVVVAPEPATPARPSIQLLPREFLDPAGGHRLSIGYQNLAKSTIFGWRLSRTNLLHTAEVQARVVVSDEFRLIVF